MGREKEPGDLYGSWLVAGCVEARNKTDISEYPRLWADNWKFRDNHYSLRHCYQFDVAEPHIEENTRDEVKMIETGKVVRICIQDF